MKLKTLKPKVASINTSAAKAKVVQRVKGRPWERLREQVFGRDKWLCQDCLPERVTVAHEIDHILPLHKGGGNNLENLQALCIECHKRKSEREMRERE